MRANGTATRVLVGVALACAIGGCGGGASSNARTPGPASAVALLEAGATLLDQGHDGAAARLLSQAVGRDPGEIVARYDLAVADQDSDDLRAAAVQYAEVLRRDPSDVPALYNEATLVAVHNPPLAMFDYRRAIALQPDSPTAFLNLGLLESDTRALRVQAARDLKRAVTLEPVLSERIPHAVEIALRTAPRITLKTAGAPGRRRQQKGV